MFGVNLFIGPDYYCSVVQNKVIRGDAPTAVKSNVGFLLSGPLVEKFVNRAHTTSMMKVLVIHKAEALENRISRSRK